MNHSVTILGYRALNLWELSTKQIFSRSFMCASDVLERLGVLAETYPQLGLASALST